MADRTERRASRRILVGPEHTIQFRASGHAFQNVRITNLSLQGCFAMVRQRDAALFVQGTLLEGFAFEHPGLALGPVVARVRYTLGGTRATSVFEFMGVGIHFASMEDASAKALAEFLEQLA